MNTSKWDAVAMDFARQDFEPVNGWEKWSEQAVSEATTIRSALPLEAETLVEIGCGIGRLTPYLAMLFRNVIATDTSPSCRIVTAKRCEHRPNVSVREPDAWPADAAVIWGNLYDDDWTTEAADQHLSIVRDLYALVLVGTAESHWLYTRE